MEEDNQAAFVQYDQQGDKILNVGILTKQEQSYFDKAKEQHRKNMIKQQKVGTKVFKGKAFIAKPDTILFKDFTVGKIHILTITLTNVSNAFNSFNVLPLPQKIRNYFELQYTPKGKISPGMSCDIKFKFIPQINEDIHSQFQVLAETGKIAYPIVCTSKKTIVKCDNTLIDFGKIIYGQVGNAKISLINQGTLPSDIFFQTLNGQQLVKCQDLKIKQLINQLVIQKNYQITGNSQKIINIQLKPTNIGKYQLQLQLYIKNFAYSPPIKLTLIASCVQVPVTVEKQLYNFQICLLNHIYRQKLTFMNKGDNPMSFKMIQPSQTRKYFQFNPMIGYIQKQSKIQVWIKFTAEKDLPIFLNKYLQGQNIYVAPFHMLVKEQVLPVYFNIKFKITTQKLKIKPFQINFGTIFEGLSSKVQITFQNESQLPQQILLYPLKKQIFVQNDQPLFKILPKQTIKTYIIYRSKTLDQYGRSFKEDGSIPCKIITGEIATNQIKLDYTAQTIRPQLSLINNKIDMPALQIDQICTSSTKIRNNSNKDIIFEIFVPYFQICGLKLTPVVQILSPKQQIQINIQYHSFMKKIGPFTIKNIQQKSQINKHQKQQIKQQVIQNKKQSKKDNKKQTKLTKQQQQQLQLQQKMQQQAQRLKKQKQQQQRLQLQKNFDFQSQLNKYGGKFYDFGNSQHYKWLLPIYFKQKDYPDASSEINFLEITTTSTQKVLTSDYMEIDFGEIAVGGRQVRQLKIFNKGETMQLHKVQLPVFCCFNVLNTMKQIQCQKYFKAVIQFQPIQEQNFQQVLTFYTQKSRISCKLKGKGVRPQITIDPESGLLNLGSVLLDQFSQRAFKIKNICNFQIQFTLKKILSGLTNSNSSNPITYIPTNGIIQPNTSIEIKIKFKPDRISQKYFQKINIYVPQQKQQKYLYVWGSCYPRQAYIADYKQRSIPLNQVVQNKVQYPFDNLRIKDQDQVYGLINKKIVLQYTKITQLTKTNQLCYKKKLIIGSCKLLDNKLQKPTNFQIIMPKDDKFICDNLKGTVNAGNEIIITFTYKPSDDDPFIAKIPILAGIGQWKDTKCQLKLSGGFLKVGGQDAISLDIILRAYINQL